MFFKSQVSLAETCEEEPSTLTSFAKVISDEDSLSFDSHNGLASECEVEICQDFMLGGCCMKGADCELAHVAEPSQQRKIRRWRLKMWLWEEIPEIGLIEGRRANSFLS